MQTAHALNGTGLLPWRGSVRAAFEAQYASLLRSRSISSSGLTYVGSLVGFCNVLLLCAVTDDSNTTMWPFCQACVICSQLQESIYSQDRIFERAVRAVA